MRLLVLTLFCAGCATTPLRWQDTLRGDTSRKPIALDAYSECSRDAAGCLQRGQSLLASNETFVEGVHRIMAACAFGSDPACALLEQRAKRPNPQAESMHPPIPQTWVAHPQNGTEHIVCELPENGRLTNCRASGDLGYAAPELLKSVTGLAVPPMTFDGKPVPTDFQFEMRFELPCDASDPSHCV